MIWRCDLTPQAEIYAERMIALTREIFSTGKYILGKELLAFENAFAAYVGTNHCVGVANGTDALILAMRLIGVGPGDEVITTPFTAIPTISAIASLGARPVFVDIDPDTYLLRIEQVPAAVTAKTRAIIPVHLFSQMVDIEKLRSLLPRPIPIIEDAAQAHGCRLRGRMAGTLGEFSAFSFYPTKNLGGYGDGGAVLTNDPEHDRKLRLLRNYGKETADRIVLDGVNSRLDELQAAYLRLKLPDLENMNERRREIVESYRSGLRGLPIAMPIISPDAVPNYHVFVVKVLGDRDGLKSYLMDHQIQTDVFYPYPHHLQPAYSALGYKRGDFPQAEKVGSTVLALPMYPEMGRSQIDEVVRVIRAFFESRSKS